MYNSDMRYVFTCLFVCLVSTSLATPQFTRQTKLACMSCHSHVPKLNSFGEQFLANGYRIPGQRRNRTVPAAVWASSLGQNSPANPGRLKVFPNRVEVISAGSTESGNMSYFAEWRMLSKELLSDGTVRDRSGRFEDLFGIATLGGGLQVQLGQFRALSQIDVSRRLNLSEPVAFSSSLAGESDPDSRVQSLRGFSPSGRSPAIRLMTQRNGWTGAATLVFPGEFSIPLSPEALTTASMAFERNPKGVFLEAFRREGVNSIGVHAFLGRNKRELFGVAAQHQWNDLWFEGGVTQARIGPAREWRYSLGFDWIKSCGFASGLRIDHRQVAGQTAQFLPYVSYLRPFGEDAARLVLEGRFQRTRQPVWVIELGWMF